MSLLDRSREMLSPRVSASPAPGAVLMEPLRLSPRTLRASRPSAQACRLERYDLV